VSLQLFSLVGRTALVTGSSRGLGLAIATGMAQAGAKVILNGVDAVRLKDSTAQLQAQNLAVESLAFDVTDEAAVVAAFAQFDQRHVDIDILVNNAGIQYRKPMIELALADWQRVIDTNLTSAFLVGREAAKRMIARGKGGKVINIGSLMSEVGRNTIAPYTAAKGGIKMLTRAMTAEWAIHNIQANAIGPGYFHTQMNQALVDNLTFDAFVKGRTPAKRWGQPEELIGTAIFLASSASDFVNGQIVYVDGGMLAALQ
jgi:gluconate 5-dehydrogenase